MAAIDFPDSPGEGDTYVVEGVTWTWTGSVWKGIGIPTKGDKGDKGDTGDTGADSTVQGPQGEPGTDGIDGIDGIDGLGVPPGGNTADVLVKVSSYDNDTAWIQQNFRIFADVTARTEAVSVPTAGMISYLEDSKAYESYDGASWVPQVEIGSWKTWAPTMTGFANGNGVWDAKYTQIGKTVHFTAFFTAGSTTTFGSGLSISLPIPALASSTARLVTGYFAKGTTRHTFSMTASSTTAVTLAALNSAGTYVQTTNITSAIPFTWATGDTIQIAGTYEAA
jgi:hypothetical protein